MGNEYDVTRAGSTGQVSGNNNGSKTIKITIDGKEIEIPLSNPGAKIDVPGCKDIDFIRNLPEDAIKYPVDPYFRPVPGDVVPIDDLVNLPELTPEKLKDLILKKDLTPEQKAAKEELGKKTSSTGVTLDDAEKKMSEIKDKFQSLCKRFVASKQSENTLEYRMGHYEFAPDMLPEPEKSQYFEAQAAFNEIITNNPELASKAGINSESIPNPAKPSEHTFDSSIIDNDGKIEFKQSAKNTTVTTPTNPTAEQQEASNKFNELKASDGTSFADAKKVLDEIVAKYKDNIKYMSTYSYTEKHDNELKYKPHFGEEHEQGYTAFDPSKLPEPDKTNFNKALDAALEIQKKNSALAQKAGIKVEDYKLRKPYVEDNGIRLYKRPV